MKHPRPGPGARRAFLQRALTLGAAAFLQPLGGCAVSNVRFSAYPFTLGVASGAPATDGVVLWTRLAPKPLEGGGMDPVSVDVRWEVAADASFARIVRAGGATAHPGAAHTVHVDVDGLEPAREYWYRFVAGGEVSPVARTRTAPAAGRGDERLRIALGSCQHYEQGWYTAHRHLAAEGVDLVAFVGDYIYESSWGRDFVRKYDAPEPYTLEAYRGRYAIHKSDADLQLAHHCAPWIVTWDDHEVDNDYADDVAEDLEPNFLARRAAAYQAFLEHMPVRRATLEPNGGYHLFRRHDWGALAQFHVVDDRQYRAHEVCPKPNRGGSNVVSDAECPERLDASRTIFGAEQERWIEEGFARSRARWNVIVQQTLMATAGQPQPDGSLKHWTDGWDGYPAAREKLLDTMVRTRLANPVVLGGDVHATYIADLRVHPERLDTPIVASEFCGTSITSQGPSHARTEAIRSVNPHIHFANGMKRGYVLVDFGRDRAEARVRVVGTVKEKDSPISTIGTFQVEAGRPGIQA
jgi:alkaline phosphatase D